MRGAPGFWWVVGGLSVAALWAASGLYFGVAVGAVGPEGPSPDAPLPEYVEAYLSYRRALFPFERWENWLLTTALLGLGLLAAGLLVGPGQRRAAAARLGAVTVACGAVVAALAQMIYLGLVERVFAVSELTYFDIGTLATLVDVATRTDDYVENLGFILIAVGLVALALSREPGADESRLFILTCWVLAGSLVALVTASFAGIDVLDPLMLLVGFVLAPAWMLEMARTLGAGATDAR
jgi:hypothetical protein